MTLLETVKLAIERNQNMGRNMYYGLTSSEIGVYNREAMFGEDDEAFPDEEEWSMWVD